eukprot:CAMPEP_0194756848 /NCGR_PEP_ID=MMETSP0323_2-20130528/10477_1 /TAXON_ID=2866 ORGANISM="Crypthecodinium cohnii, Strain Seligo" /NCGR_SAMPLE_ID=MMETSP0323_2 /ASSEMBLY_ACC=CAM_ASM_000346 /LENGTH=54 /DNA_ID=CAMNT_0039676545 /DNA_START=588 /DNA_END=749 /DNA_ORIENTATION=-
MEKKMMMATMMATSQTNEATKSIDQERPSAATAGGLEVGADGALAAATAAAAAA